MIAPAAQQTDNPVASLSAIRLPPLEGSRNFRDIGGYLTHDGRHVRWGQIFRSGSLAGLTSAGHDYFRALNIRSLCDLRTNAERVAEPYTWCEAAGIAYWSRDYETSFGELRSVMASGLADAESARAAMINGYRHLPYEQALAYKAVFRQLEAGQVPLVFNCSAGKDRAGTAAALILSALGVSREVVIEDYALSDKIVDFESAYSSQTSGTGLMAQVPRGVVSAIFRSDPVYMETALDAIAEQSGSLENYIRDVLNIDAQALAKIRGLLLE